MENPHVFERNVAYILRVLFLFFLGLLAYLDFLHILFANLITMLLLFLPIFIRKKEHLKIPFEIELFFIIFLVFSSIVSYFFSFSVHILFGLSLGFISFICVFLILFDREHKISIWKISLFSVFTSMALVCFAESLKFFLKVLFGMSISLGDYFFAAQNFLFVFIFSVITSFCGFFYFKKLRKVFLRRLVGTMKSENPNFFVTRSKVLEDVKREIFLGEGERTEFKSCLRMNLHTCQPDHKIEFAVLRSIASFLNSSGGSLFLGVSDNKEILGLEKDGFENLDLFNRHLTNLLKENIGAEFLPFLSFDFFNLDGKVILRINCMKSIGPVFLKSDGREDFFVRFGASTISLSGNRMLEYIRGNF